MEAAAWNILHSPSMLDFASRRTRFACVIVVWAFVAWFGWNAIERHNSGVLICYVIFGAFGVATLANWIWKQATKD
jgi:hypothetical protein